jgi:hypothetical protein
VVGAWSVVDTDWGSAITWSVVDTAWGATGGVCHDIVGAGDFMRSLLPFENSVPPQGQRLVALPLIAPQLRHAFPFLSFEFGSGSASPSWQKVTMAWPADAQVLMLSFSSDMN